MHSVVTLDGNSLSVDFLIHNRFVLNDLFTAGCLQQECSGLVDCQSLSSIETEPDQTRIGLRRYHEVVLQLSLISVVGQINSWVHAFKFHATIGADIFPPLRWFIAN